MGCCGSRQIITASGTALSLRTHSAYPALNEPAALATRLTASAAAGRVTVRYCGNSTILVRGPVTGQTYRFSAAEPNQDVDARDVESLVRAALFQRV
jgi:hypothetical protein